MSRIILFITILAMAAYGQIALTVYSDGFALVKESRTISVGKGITQYDYTPVPSGIMPQTVHLSADGIAVLEQNYEYDLVSTERLLEKGVDSEIRVYTEKEGPYQGTLLSSDGTTILLDINGQLTSLLVEKTTAVNFIERPDRLFTRPTLAWLLYSDKAGKKDTELSYMTNGVGWQAAYIATVNKDDTRLALDGWVTINNFSGMTYKDAMLKLVAGEVHRAEVLGRGAGAPKGVTMDMAEAAAGFEEEAFFEYHLYTLPRPATVADRQEKQLSLFEPAETDAEKVFVFEPFRGDKVRVEMEFVNSEEKGLGMPLPEGVIRVYKEDKSGALQFVGEDRIEHTPKDEEIRIYLGNAFDVVAERNRIDYRRISNRVYEEDYEIKLRNHKDEDIIVKVVEHFWGDWFIKAENIEGNKEDARTNEWEVPVPADEEVTLTFTVRHK